MSMSVAGGRSKEKAASGDKQGLRAWPREALSWRVLSRDIILLLMTSMDSTVVSTNLLGCFFLESYPHFLTYHFLQRLNLPLRFTVCYEQPDVTTFTTPVTVFLMEIKIHHPVTSPSQQHNKVQNAEGFTVTFSFTIY